jgi:hypothetical protein
MVTLLLALAIAAPDARPAVVELARLEGRWLSEAGTELVIQAGTIRVDGHDGFNHFSGRLLLHPATGRFAIVDAAGTTECRYRLGDDVLRLTVGATTVQYGRVRLAEAAK